MKLTEQELEYIRQSRRGDRIGLITVGVVWILFLAVLIYSLWSEDRYLDVRGVDRLVLSMNLWLSTWQNPDGLATITWTEVALIQKTTWAFFFFLIGLLVSFFKFLDIRQNAVIHKLLDDMLKHEGERKGG